MRRRTTVKPRPLLPSCICGECVWCPDGYHGNDRACICTADCAHTKDGDCPCGVDHREETTR